MVDAKILKSDSLENIRNPGDDHGAIGTCAYQPIVGSSFARLALFREKPTEKQQVQKIKGTVMPAFIPQQTPDRVNGNVCNWVVSRTTAYKNQSRLGVV